MITVLVLALLLGLSSPLDFLVGTWKSDSGGSEASYRWDVGRAWLVFESRSEIPGRGPQEVNGAIRLDPDSRAYRAYAVNSFGMSFQYDGSLEGDTLVLVESQKRSRLTYEKRTDGTLRFVSEQKGEDGVFRPVAIQTLKRR